MAKFLNKTPAKSDSGTGGDEQGGSVSANESYIPPHALMKKLIRRDRNAAGEETVSMPAAAFQRLLEAAVVGLFDEASYLERYADVREAVAAGKLQSGLEHFVNDGYLEGRNGLSYPVDEEWYVKTYPDVALAIKSGKVRNGAHHFQAFGFNEGRVPGRALQKSVAQWRDLERKKSGSA